MNKLSELIKLDKQRLKLIEILNCADLTLSDICFYKTRLKAVERDMRKITLKPKKTTTQLKLIK